MLGATVPCNGYAQTLWSACPHQVWVQTLFASESTDRLPPIGPALREALIKALTQCTRMSAPW